MALTPGSTAATQLEVHALRAQWISQKRALEDLVQQHLRAQEELLDSLLERFRDSTPGSDSTGCTRAERSNFESKTVSGWCSVSDANSSGDIMQPDDTSEADLKELSIVPVETMEDRPVHSRRPAYASAPPSYSSSGPPSTSATLQKKIKQRQSFLALIDDDSTAKKPVTLESKPAWQVRIFAFMQWWAELQEPPRRGRIASVIKHRRFDMAVSFMIAANSVYTTHQANYEMEYLGARPPNDDLFEFGFLMFFIIELAAKLFVHRLYFFCNDDMVWNIFDFTLVTFAAIDQMLLVIGASFGSVAFARALRIFKMGKILRVFKALRFLRELRVMVSSILGSFVSLFWSFIMLGMILYVFGLFFVQQMAAHLKYTEDQQEGEMWQLSRFYFGDVQRTMLTLSMSTTGGKNWEDIHKLIEPLGVIPVFAYIFYVSFFTFAVINILTGIFVENAMKLCKPDDEEAIVEQNKKLAQDKEQLRWIMEWIDTDGSGSLSLDEFQEAISKERVVHALTSLGIDVKNAEYFFRTVATASGQAEVDIDDFVDHAVRMKGTASSIDLHGLIFQTTLLQQSVNKSRAEQAEMAKQLAELVAAPEACQLGNNVGEIGSLLGGSRAEKLAGLGPTASSVRQVAARQGLCGNDGGQQESPIPGAVP